MNTKQMLSFYDYFILACCLVSENRVTQEQLMEDGILTEKEINKSFVTSVDG